VHYKTAEWLSKGLVALGIIYLGAIGRVHGTFALAAAVSIVIGVEVAEKLVVRILVERFINQTKKYPEQQSSETEKIANNLNETLKEMNDNE